jgi:hypothetical protein
MPLVRNERRTRQGTLPHIDPVIPNAHHFPFVRLGEHRVETQAGSSTGIQHPVDSTSQSAKRESVEERGAVWKQQPLYLVTLYAPTSQRKPHGDLDAARDADDERRRQLREEFKTKRDGHG